MCRPFFLVVDHGWMKPPYKLGSSHILLRPRLVGTRSSARNETNIALQIQVHQRPCPITQLADGRLPQRALEDGRARPAPVPVFAIPAPAPVGRFVRDLIPTHTLQHHRGLLASRSHGEDVHPVAVALHRPHLERVIVLGVIGPVFPSVDRARPA